jgi:hypothetical protein
MRTCPENGDENLGPFTARITAPVKAGSNYTVIYHTSMGFEGLSQNTDACLTFAL